MKSSISFNFSSSMPYVQDAKIYRCYMISIWWCQPTWFSFVRLSLQYHRLMCNVIKAIKPHVIDVCHLFWCPFITSLSLWSWQIFLSKEDWDIACTLVSLNTAANHTWTEVFEPKIKPIMTLLLLLWMYCFYLWYFRTPF